MLKLSIAVDMGAKNNGIFIAKTSGDNIEEKKAFNIVVDKDINFSKKSRRENRHRVRNYKRRKLAKRLLWDILDKSNFDNNQIEQINGLLNNRGYTFLSTASEFEELQDETVEFINEYLKELKEKRTKEDFEAFLSEFELDNLKDFIDKTTQNLDREYKKKKSEFYKEFQTKHSIIKKDLKTIKEFLNDILKEIQTGSKPRKKYLQEIKEEIEKLDFIEDKKSFYNLVGNVSNLQLRILRKFFDNTKRKKDKFELLKDYFNFFHWNYNDKEKKQKNELFSELRKYDNLEEFFKNCDPLLTIPPYEDMNNRGTYKCNSLIINPEYITESLKKSIDILWSQKEFEVLHSDNLKYPQKLQRILDISYKMIDKQIHPREVFKKDKGNIRFYQKLLKENLKEFSGFAKEYYILEQKAINGIFENGLLLKCDKNTPSKNNFKHILLKPLYEYDFTKEEAEEFYEKIKNTKGLQRHLKRVSEVAKDYQNSFYRYIEACYENSKCLDDKRVKDIVKNIDNDLKSFKHLFNELNIKTYLNKIEKIDKDNLKRVINIFKQTYEILFKDINGFSKTCKTCTIENNYRSSGDEAIAKRLLSDVAKPIDGMLDFMLDKIAFEIIEQIDSIEDKVEIILEQNRFNFEDNLVSIKGKKPKKREAKDILNLNICPYSGENITETNGEYDHILPQSKELFNSKANLIYCSSEGNRKKSNNRYYLENLNIKHLKEIFKTDSLDEIKNIIQDGIKKIDIDKFTNFENLSLKEQIALRYALFCDENSNEFKKAKEIIKKDKLKTITNGTQKRLARLIYQKLSAKFDKKFDCSVKVIDNLLISATRKDLSYDKTTGEINELWKDKNQNSHSHCIDAMVAFYLANSSIKGSYHQKRDNLASIESDFEFDNIYIKDSNIINLIKKQTFINAKDISSYKMFQDTIYSENYHHIDKNHKDINTLIKYSLLYQNKNNKKYFINSYEELQDNIIYKIDVYKTSKLLFKLFSDKNKQALNELKFLDKLRYNTTRSDIAKIFFDEKQTKLLEFEKIKNIPPNSIKTFKAVYNILKQNDIFDKLDGKKLLNKDRLHKLLEKTFKLQKRKRGKKRHIFSLAILGQNAKYRIKRGNAIQVLGGENIATKNYIIDGNIKPIPFFSKNTIPLKVADLIDCLLVDKNTPSIYEVDINIDDLKEYLLKLTYIVTEAKRVTIQATFNKKIFDFDGINFYDGAKDEKFAFFIKEFIDNKDLILSKYIGSIRDGIKAKAAILDNNNDNITLSFKSATTKDKKEIILKNLKATND